MENYKYIILGGGPAGLSFANQLLIIGIDSFILLEKEKDAGGLCRSEDVDKSPIDIGGGHFLDTKRTQVLNFLFKFLPKKEWNLYNRSSKINYKEKEIDYPFEANIWQLDSNDQIDFLESIANAGANKKKEKPKLFKNWITWKLGEKIANEYMLPYNQKIFSCNLNKLGTYWLYKLPSVSFRDTLQSVIEKKSIGRIPAHAKFYYPKKYGYGEVWKRMANNLTEKIYLTEKVKNVDPNKLIVNGKFTADYIINTIPWSEWLNFKSVPSDIKKIIKQLEYSGIRIDYFSSQYPSKAHWVYDPDKNKSYHRILCRNNFSDDAKGYWTESNILRTSNIKSEWNHKNTYAYPLNTKNKPDVIKEILNWGIKKNIYGLGRWGEWEHMNSDVTVEKAIKLANELS